VGDVRASPLRALPLAIAALFACALSPGLARADDEDRLAPIRDEVKRLEAEGRLESALALLRGVKEETLDPGSQLERAQRIDALTTAQIERYADDRTKAVVLEKQGKPAEAARVLSAVEVYGSAKQRAEASSEVKRLEAAAAAGGATPPTGASGAPSTGKPATTAPEAAKPDADAKKKAAAEAADLAELQKVVKRWLDARRQLACSTCKGAKLVKCGPCEGSGKITILSAGPVGTGRSGATSAPCRKCETQGRIPCAAESCKGSGMNSIKAKQVVWDPLPKAYRDDLTARGLNEKRFTDGLRALGAGRPAPPEVSQCVGAVPGVLVAIKGHDTFALEIGEDGVAVARYFVKRDLDGGVEETRWIKADGAWCMPAPKAGAEPGKAPRDGE